MATRLTLSPTGRASHLGASAFRHFLG